MALASAGGDFEGLQQVAGAVLLVPGAPTLGFGVYVALHSPTVIELVPGVPTGE